MSTNPKLKATSSRRVTHKVIDRAIAKLAADMHVINAVKTDTLNGRIARLVMIYEGIEPLLTMMTTASLIPTNWRTAVAQFNQALAAVVGGLDEKTAGFKAGKDLES
jgi:hypothetical protein